MAIEKPMAPGPDFEIIDDTVMVFNEEELDGQDLESEDGVTLLEDGGMEIDLSGEPEPDEEAILAAEEHDANLAEYIDEGELLVMGSDIVQMFQDDLHSRRDWEQTYMDGLDMLGLKYEDRSEPWDGAFGGFHPMITEAVVRFQSSTIGEILPAKGPVKTQVVGNQTEERIKQGRRVEAYMNYVVMNEMREFRRETERLLWTLPIAGSGFKKVFSVGSTKPRGKSIFVPPEDVVVNWSEAGLEEAERITHRMRMSPNQIRRAQFDGRFRDVELGSPAIDVDQIRDKKNDAQGTKTDHNSKDARHVILECQVDMDMPGFEHEIPLPYVVTVDEATSTVMSIRRNWTEGDSEYRRQQHFAHYEYIPGFGFYGFGLVHLIGSLARGSTSLLRQLVDAGTLSNLPGGLKARGFNVLGDEGPIMPGEWRDVDMPGGTIRDNIMPLPYKEPSQTLFALLGMLSEEGRRFASAADINAKDMQSEAPVGTTLAILEQSLKVQTAVQQRVHESMKVELGILARVLREETDLEYPYEPENGEGVAKEDFDERVDIIPVTDPNASTFAQRVMQFQAALQLSQTAPQIWDLRKLHRMGAEMLGLPQVEGLVPAPDEVPPMDPVAENMAIINMQPVKAYEYQDHSAHIRTLLALRNDPALQEQLQNSPTGAAVGGSIDAHMREHLAFEYRSQIERELGTKLPPLGQPLPEDVEARLSSLVADAADQLLGTKKAMAEAEKNAQLMQDPVIQQKQAEIEIRMGDLRRKQEADQQKAAIDMARIASQERIAIMNADQRKEESELEAEVDRETRSVDSTLSAIRLGAEIAEKGGKD